MVLAQMKTVEKKTALFQERNLNYCRSRNNYSKLIVSYNSSRLQNLLTVNQALVQEELISHLVRRSSHLQVLSPRQVKIPSLALCLKADPNTQKPRMTLQMRI